MPDQTVGSSLITTVNTNRVYRYSYSKESESGSSNPDTGDKYRELLKINTEITSALLIAQNENTKLKEENEEFKKSNQSLKLQTDELTFEIETLKTNIEWLKRSQRSSTSDLELQVKLLQDQLEQEKAKVAKKKLQNEDLQRQRDELIQSSASDSRVQFWKKMIEDQKQMLEEKDNKLFLMSEESSYLHEQLEKTRSALRLANDDLSESRSFNNRSTSDDDLEELQRINLEKQLILEEKENQIKTLKGKILSLETELEELKELNEFSGDSKNQFITHINNLSEDLGKKRKELAAKEKECEELKKRMEELHASSDKLQNRVSDLEREVQRHVEEKIKLETEREHLIVSLRELESQQELISEIEELEQELHIQIEKSTKLEKDKNEWRDLNSTNEAIIDQLRADVENYKEVIRERDILVEGLERSREEVDRLTDLLNQATQREKLKQHEVTNSRKEIENIRTEITTIETYKKTAEDQLAVYKQQNAQLKQDVRNMEDLIREKEEAHSNQIHKLENAINDSKLKIKHMEEYREEWKAILSRNEQIIQELRTSLDQRLEELKKIKNQLYHLQEDKNQLQNKIDELENELAHHREYKKIAEEKRKHLEQELTHLEINMKSEQSKQETLDQLREDIKRIHIRIEELEYEKGVLSKELENKKEDNNKLQEELQAANNNLHIVRHECDLNTGRVAQLDEEVKGLKESNTKLENDLTDALKKANAQNEETSSLSAQLYKATSELEEEQRKTAALEQRAADLDNTVQLLTAQISNLNHSIESQRKQMETLMESEEKEKLRETVQQQQKALNNLQAALDSKQEQIEDLEEERKSLANKLNQAIQDIDELQHAVAGERSLRESAENNLVLSERQAAQSEKLLRDNEALEEELQETKDKLSAANMIRDKYDEALRDKRRLQGQYDVLFNQCEDLKNEIDSTKEILNDAQRQITQLKSADTKNDELVVLNEAANISLENTKKDLELANAKNSQLEKEVAILKLQAESGPKSADITKLERQILDQERVIGQLRVSSSEKMLLLEQADQFAQDLVKNKNKIAECLRDFKALKNVHDQYEQYYTEAEKMKLKYRTTAEKQNEIIVSLKDDNSKVQAITKLLNDKKAALAQPDAQDKSVITADLIDELSSILAKRSDEYREKRLSLSKIDDEEFNKQFMLNQFLDETSSIGSKVDDDEFSKQMRLDENSSGTKVTTKRTSRRRIAKQILGNLASQPQQQE